LGLKKHPNFKTRRGEGRLKYFWVINDYNSIALFHRNYSDIVIDSDLVSGLLSALNSFSKEEIGQQIETISMVGLNWSYLEDKKNELLFVAAADKGTDSHILKSQLQVLGNSFVKEFNITPSMSKEFNGDVSKYETFAITADLLIQQWSEIDKITSTAELFDLLGVFQQVFHLFINIINLNFFTKKMLDKINKSIKSKLEEILNADEFKDDMELQKIVFDVKTGWNIFTVNPAKVTSGKNLQTVLLKLTAEIKKILSKELGRMVTLDSLRREVFPFMLNNWSLISKLQLHKKLLNIFLIEN
jgi:hypothetical protein